MTDEAAAKDEVAATDEDPEKGEDAVNGAGGGGDADEDGDQFSRKIERYTELFANEWEIIKLLPLYDFDGDDAFSDTERRGSYSRRTARR